MTLHRLLGCGPDNNTRFRHDRGNRLASRRGDRRRDVDGRPDADGPTPGGGPTRELAWSWSATPTSSPPSGRARCSPTSSTDLQRAPTHPCARCAPTTASDPRSPPWPRRCATATATGCRGAARRRRAVVFVEVDGPDAAADALRADLLATGHALRAAGQAGDAQAALDALDDHRLICAHRDGPHGVAPLEPLGRALAGEEAGVGTGPAWYAGRPAAGHLQRLRSRHLQRRAPASVIQRPDGSLRGVIDGSQGARRASPPAGSPTSRRCTR